MFGRGWEGIDAAVEAVQSTDQSVDLSFFPGASDRRGRIENIHEGNFTPGHLVLAAYENMAGNYAKAAAMLFPSGDWGLLALSGGLAHRATRLRQLISERLQRSYRLS